MTVGRRGRHEIEGGAVGRSPRCGRRKESRAAYHSPAGRETDLRITGGVSLSPQESLLSDRADNGRVRGGAPLNELVPLARKEQQARHSQGAV